MLLVFLTKSSVFSLAQNILSKISHHGYIIDSKVVYCCFNLYCLITNKTLSAYPWNSKYRCSRNKYDSWKLIETILKKYFIPEIWKIFRIHAQIRNFCDIVRAPKNVLISEVQTFVLMTFFLLEVTLCIDDDVMKKIFIEKIYKSVGKSVDLFLFCRILVLPKFQF